MDAATITAWLSGIGLVLKATAVLVTAIRARRAAAPPDDATQDTATETAGV